MVPSISPPALGLTADSSNEDILRAAFDFVHSIGYMTFATTAVDGKTPTIREANISTMRWNSTLSSRLWPSMSWRYG